jgi:hypothetical protein
VNDTLNNGAGEAPVSIIGRTCVFLSKKQSFFERRKFVSAYEERGKKFFRNLPILQKLPTDLIEK